MARIAYAAGGLTLLVLWVLYGLATGTWNPAKIVEGKDGRPSTSKFQWFLWTAVAIFSYVAVLATKVMTEQLGENIAIPNNLLLAMGFATATAAIANKVGALSHERGQKKTVSDLTNAGTQAKGTGWVGLVGDDDAAPDLSKIQMLAWTMLAVVAYLFALSHQIALAEPLSQLTELPDVSSLPDIDSTLMALMGLGQGGYLGKKIAELK